MSLEIIDDASFCTVAKKGKKSRTEGCAAEIDSLISKNLDKLKMTNSGIVLDLEDFPELYENCDMFEPSEVKKRALALTMSFRKTLLLRHGYKVFIRYGYRNNRYVFVLRLEK